MRIHVLCTNRGTSLQGLFHFAKGPTGINKTVPKRYYKAPATAISILHQQTIEYFLILGVHVRSWKEISSRKKKKIRKNKAQHFLKVTTKSFLPTKQTRKQIIKPVTTGPLQIPILFSLISLLCKATLALLTASGSFKALL